MLLSLTAWIVLAGAPVQGAQAPRFAEAAAAPACRVTGVVIDVQTRAGVSGATVTLRGAAEAPPAADESARACNDGCETTAGPDGHFAFDGLLPGAYAVSASV